MRLCNTSIPLSLCGVFLLYICCHCFSFGASNKAFSESLVFLAIFISQHPSLFKFEVTIYNLFTELILWNRIIVFFCISIFCRFCFVTPTTLALLSSQKDMLPHYLVLGLSIYRKANRMIVKFYSFVFWFLFSFTLS